MKLLFIPSQCIPNLIDHNYIGDDVCLIVVDSDGIMIGKHVDILLIKQQRLSMSKHPLDTQLPTVDALFCTGTHPRDSLTNIANIQ